MLTALLISVSWGQTYEIVPAQSKINYLKSEAGKSSTVSQEVEVKVAFRGPAPTNNVQLSFVISNPYVISFAFNPTIVNIPVGGYVIPKEKFGSSYDTMTFKVNININASPVIARNEFFDLQLTGSIGAANPSHRVIIESISTEEAETIASKKKKNPITDILFLNAYNFDFGSTGLSSNYVGHLNFYVPSCTKSKKWGFTTGIMKINYGQKDTSNGIFVRENVFINPFDTVATGLKYLKQINAYKIEKKNTVWSFYVQPLYELTEKQDNFHVYAHAHLELLASKWSSTTTVTNIKQDTGIIMLPANSFVIRSALQSSSTYTVNSLSGYFGFGLTFDIKPWNGGSFFFQPTIGVTSNKPSPSSVDLNSSSAIYSNSKTDKPRIWNAFYLVRAYYKHVIAEDKATAVIGVDIRGLLPFYAPQYAAYVGLNLTLKSIFDLVSNNK